ncbi:MAG: hypothetical protein ACOX1P_07030 [Thermoguttaceae bacterium]
MPNPNPTSIHPSIFLEQLRTHPWRWLAPTVVITALAAVYAVLKPAEWDAVQALAIRNEAANNADGPGKFSHPEARRTAQETVLELARSRSVLSAALARVGPPAGRRIGAGAWPSEKQVDDFRRQVTLSPPQGAELGKAEVFHLTVRDRSRQRALALVSAVCDQLQASCQRLRDATAASMMEELRQAANIARADLEASTGRVAEMETQVGEDLSELRMLHESYSGDSALQRTATQLRDEIRQTEAALESNEQLLKLLAHAEREPSRLVAAPNRLIESQPGLRRLKEGLVDSQLRTAALLGRMTESHPLVAAGKESEEEVRRQIRSELAEAINSLQLEFRLNSDRLARLQDQLQKIDARLARLARLRTQYSIHVAEMQNRAELLKRAEEELSKASIAEAAAKTSSLLVPIDGPAAAAEPAGPGRAVIALVGLVAALLIGIGIAVLTIPTPAVQPATPVAVEELPAVLRSSHVSTVPPRRGKGGALTLREALAEVAAFSQSK